MSKNEERQGTLPPGDRDLINALDRSIREHLPVHAEKKDAAQRAANEEREFRGLVQTEFRLFRDLTGEDHDLADEFRNRVEGDFYVLTQGRTQRLQESQRQLAAYLESASRSARNIQVHVAIPQGRLGEIYRVLEGSHLPLRAQEIVDELVRKGQLGAVENPVQAISASLSRGVQQGLFWRPERGLYALADADVAASEGGDDDGPGINTEP